MYTFQDVVIAHVFIAIEDIAWSFTCQHYVEKLLGSETVLCKQGIFFHVDVVKDVVDTFC